VEDLELQLVALDVVVKATTKKVVNFLRKKVHPRQNPGCAYDCNSNWGTCIAPCIRRPRVHHRVNPYSGACKQNQTEMFSDDDETSPSIAAVSAPSAVCYTLAVQQQKRLCRQFVDVSAARRGWHKVSKIRQSATGLLSWEVSEMPEWIFRVRHIRVEATS